MPEQKQIPDKGMSSFEIKQYLKAYKTFDLDYKKGGVFAYVYPLKRDDWSSIGKWAYTQFLTENGLDPTVFPSLARIENEVVSMTLHHANAPEEAVGNFSSGGTESIFCALKAAREYGKKVMKIEKPEVILPDTAHPAFHKAIHLMEMNFKTIPVDTTTFKADMAATRAAIGPNTVLLVGSACSYPQGVIDPITELGQLALEKKLLLHVDACIGGFVLPFFKKFGDSNQTPWDFTVPGVTSMSLDLHKYAFCPKGASIVMYRSPELRVHQLYAFADWHGYSIVNNVFQSSKSGGPMAAAWATLNKIGKEGYEGMMLDMYKATKAIAKGIAGIEGLRLVAEPESSLVAFTTTTDKLSTFKLADMMQQKGGWYVQPQLAYKDQPPNLHLSLNPQSWANTERFLEDLKWCVDNFGSFSQVALRSKVGEFIAEWEGAGEVLEDSLFERMCAYMQLSTTEPPKDLVAINVAMDEAPVGLREQLLRKFMNRLFIHDEAQARREGEEFAAKKIAELKQAAAKYLLIGLGVAALGAIVLKNR